MKNQWAVQIFQFPKNKRIQLIIKNEVANSDFFAIPGSMPMQSDQKPAVADWKNLTFKSEKSDDFPEIPNNFPPQVAPRASKDASAARNVLWQSLCRHRPASGERDPRKTPLLPWDALGFHFVFFAMFGFGELLSSTSLLVVNSDKNVVDVR